MTFPNGAPLRIYDCRGIDFRDTNTQHYIDDLIMTVDGKIEKDYEVYISLFLIFFFREVLFFKLHLRLGHSLNTWPREPTLLKVKSQSVI